MTRDDSSGYKKPPKKNQWKSGQSGNPKGRPKKSDRKYTRQEILKELFEETIPIRDGDGNRNITKKEAFFQKVYAMAMQGSGPAIKLIEKWLNEIETKETKEGMSGVLVMPAELSLQEVLKEAKKHREKAIEDEAKFREEQDAEKP